MKFGDFIAMAERGGAGAGSLTVETSGAGVSLGAMSGAGVLLGATGYEIRGIHRV